MSETKDRETSAEPDLQAMTFDDIRPFYDHEVNSITKQLCDEREFLKIVGYFFPKYPIESIKAKLQRVFSIDEFQSKVISPIVDAIIKSSTDGITCSGIDNLSKDGNYLFISNHRDIVLDSAFLNILFFKNGFRTTEIAIGSNLLIYPWITKLVKLNKSFIVNRNVPIRQIYEYSSKLSKYIRYSLTDKKNSIWIAQREGRTKNGDDRTQVSLLKMFDISGEGKIGDNYKALNIVPVAISYERESCATFKVKEIYARSKNPNYKKSIRDDLVSMTKGMQSPKGRVHFSFGTPLNEVIDFDNIETNKNNFIKFLASKIDEQIHTEFKLWPSNYIAKDMLDNEQLFAEYYTKEDFDEFSAYLNKQLSNLRGEPEVLKRLYLEIYANPLINKYQHINIIQNKTN